MLYRYVIASVFLAFFVLNWSSISVGQTAEVFELQKRLVEQGYDPGPVDGVMGFRTEEALRAFQFDNDLLATGVVDPATFSALARSPDSRDRTPPNSSSTAAPERTTSLSTGNTQSRRSAPVSGAHTNPKWWIVLVGSALLRYRLWRKKEAVDLSPVPKPNPFRQSDSKKARTPPAHKIKRSQPPIIPRSKDIIEDVGDHSHRRQVEDFDFTPDVQSVWSSPAPERSLKDQKGNIFWVPSTDSAKVGGINIGGMVYVGQGLQTEYRGVENCLIDPSLTVARRKPDSTGEHLPYWPSYSSLHPSSRQAYLQWLSSDRSDPTFPLVSLLLRARAEVHA